MIKANTTIERLQRVEVKRPAHAGRLWLGIPHIELLRQVKRSLSRLDITSGNPIAATNRSGTGVALVFPLTSLSLSKKRKEHPFVGVTNINDRRSSIQVYFGFCQGPVGFISHNEQLGLKRSDRFDLSKEIHTVLEKGVTPSGIQLLLRLFECWCNRALEIPPFFCSALRSRKLMPITRVGLMEHLLKRDADLRKSETYTGRDLSTVYRAVALRAPVLQQLDLQCRFFSLLRELESL